MASQTSVPQSSSHGYASTRPAPRQGRACPRVAMFVHLAEQPREDLLSLSPLRAGGGPSHWSEAPNPTPRIKVRPPPRPCCFELLTARPTCGHAACAVYGRRERAVMTSVILTTVDDRRGGARSRGADG